MHFVDEEYDTGPILAQCCVPVFPTDSPKRLAARVLEKVRHKDESHMSMKINNKGARCIIC